MANLQLVLQKAFLGKKKIFTEHYVKSVNPSCKSITCINLPRGFILEHKMRVVKEKNSKIDSHFHVYDFK